MIWYSAVNRLRLQGRPLAVKDPFFCDVEMVAAGIIAKRLPEGAGIKSHIERPKDAGSCEAG